MTEEQDIWEATNDNYLQSFVDDHSKEKEIINFVRKKIPLSSIIDKYKIQFLCEENQSGWRKANCPFPDHNDKTPSFGYNATDNRYFCHGCNKGGGAIDFVANMENKSLFEVAKYFLNKIDEADLPDIITNSNFENEKLVQGILLKISNLIFSFLSAYKDNEKALQYIENITWGLDCYIYKEPKAETEVLQEFYKKIEEYIIVYTE